MHNLSPTSSKVIVWCVLAACVLTCRGQESDPAPQRKDGASLGGTVLDADGNILPGARVEITAGTTRLVETSGDWVSPARGAARFTSLLTRAEAAATGRDSSVRSLVTDRSDDGRSLRL